VWVLVGMKNIQIVLLQVVWMQEIEKSVMH